jgi:hypothetical protein
MVVHGEVLLWYNAVKLYTSIIMRMRITTNSSRYSLVCLAHRVCACGALVWRRACINDKFGSMFIIQGGLAQPSKVEK